MSGKQHNLVSNPAKVEGILDGFLLYYCHTTKRAADRAAMFARQSWGYTHTRYYSTWRASNNIYQTKLTRQPVTGLIGWNAVSLKLGELYGHEYEAVRLGGRSGTG